MVRVRAPSSRADAAGLARAARERLHIPGWTTPPRPSAAARGFHRPLPADGRGGGGQRVRRGNAGNAPPTSPPSGNEAAASAGRRQAGDPGPRGAPWRWHCGWMVVEGGVPSLLSDRAIQWPSVQSATEQHVERRPISGETLVCPCCRPEPIDRLDGEATRRSSEMRVCSASAAVATGAVASCSCGKGGAARVDSIQPQFRVLPPWTVHDRVRTVQSAPQRM